jgi:hypothetical protein
MQAFRNALIDCDLVDMGFSGDHFTWRRGRIRERLDRAVSNGNWSLMHPDARVHHLGYIRSDHRPILLDTDYEPSANTQQVPKRFEAKWLKEESFRQEWSVHGRRLEVLRQGGSVV